MSDALVNLLSASHKRAVATIMRQVEKDAYPVLSIEARRELREVVVRAAGAYHDTALDCIKAISSAETAVTNERLYDLLEQVHRAVYVPTKGRT